MFPSSVIHASNDPFLGTHEVQKHLNKARRVLVIGFPASPHARNDQFPLIEDQHSLEESIYEVLPICYSAVCSWAPNLRPRSRTVVLH